MPNSSYYREQAARFDRVADQCSVPGLIAYYRQLADDYRSRADGHSPSPPGPAGPDSGCG